MKIRNLALTLIITLSMIILGSNTYAAVKAGIGCTKQGATSIVSGKKYTCIKSGKKLVWDNGVLQKSTNSVKVEKSNTNTNSTTNSASIEVL